MGRVEPPESCEQSGKSGMRFRKETSMSVWLGDHGPESGRKEEYLCTTSSLTAHVVGNRVGRTEWTGRRRLCGQRESSVDREL